MISIEACRCSKWRRQVCLDFTPDESSVRHTKRANHDSTATHADLWPRITSFGWQIAVPTSETRSRDSVNCSICGNQHFELKHVQTRVSRSAVELSATLLTNGRLSTSTNACWRNGKCAKATSFRRKNFRTILQTGSPLTFPRGRLASPVTLSKAKGLGLKYCRPEILRSLCSLRMTTKRRPPARLHTAERTKR